MSYVDGYQGVLAEISQIQSVFSSAPASAAPSGFEAVLQQVSSLSALSGSPAPASPATPDLSDSFGYPLEEGDPIAPGTGSSGPPGGGISSGPGRELDHCRRGRRCNRISSSRPPALRWPARPENRGRPNLGPAKPQASKPQASKPQPPNPGPPPRPPAPSTAAASERLSWQTPKST